MSTPTIAQIIDEHFKTMQDRFQQLEMANQRLVWFLSESMRQSGQESLTVSLEATPNITIQIDDNKDGTVTLKRQEVKAEATPLEVVE